VTPRASLFAFGSFGAFWGAWAVVLPAIKEQTGASIGQLGIALLFIAGGALPAILTTGFLIDRFGPRLLPLSGIGFAVAATLPGLTNSVWTLALALAVLGATSGALDVAINFGAARVEACGGAPIFLKAHAFFSGGFLVAAVLSGLAREVGSEALPILIAAALLVLASAWTNRAAAALPPAGERRGLALRPTRALILLGLLCGVAFVVESGIEHWSALFLETELDATPALAGLGPAFFAAAMVVGRTFGHRLQDKVGDAALLAAGGILAAAGLAAAASATSIVVGVFGFLCGGAGISVAAPVFFGAAGRGAPESERGSAVATVTTISYLGFLTGPLLVGAVSSGFDLRAGIALLAGIAVVLSLASASFGRALPLRRVEPAPRGGVS
jgi:MFS family permease